ncbi:putative cystathionine gamma-lyase 2 [Lepeophtheirus salmonis]|uniref:cystathionine gamma-lyase n=1 Tax=Lepeophtheirus salmonis TaxID=72036 RepID=C1BU59_LEPSM|nr:putative cystathionine gamma-lyase 2 [Lepeophtheirus salmonis]ACO12562.1 cystathionine gamma-lyase [Lepeophtheirus salmonis]ADD24102.1 cystathionine gamma-lyase 2 [Lepeophtheirus salmonis]
MSTYRDNDPHYATHAIHVGQNPEQWKSLAVVPHITLSTTYKQYHPGQPKEFEYGRGGNPTRNILETCMASLDGAKHCVTFASGLAALDAMTTILSCGDHIVAMNDLYGGTNRFLRRVSAKQGLTSTFVDINHEELFSASFQDNTKMVWIESPTNPTLRIVDIKKAVSIAKSKNPNIIVVVDNTFVTSYFQRPLELGADVTYYSCTKYMNGHSDVIMGAVCINSDEIHERVRFVQYAVGAVPSPFDCFLVNRSLKTLKVRMVEHQKNALIVGKFLEGHSKITKVIHPGLPSHPDHEIVKKQQYGHSGMVSFYLKGGLEESNNFLKAVKVFILAESLGGFESLAELPYSMTHASVAEEERVALGVTNNLIRLSIGLENADDLCADLDQALNIACS